MTSLKRLPLSEQVLLKALGDTCTPTMLNNLYTMAMVSKIDHRQLVPTVPCIPPTDVRLLRAQLVLEEALETVHALGFSVQVGAAEVVVRHVDDVEFFEHGSDLNLGDMIDGACDTIYVAVGVLASCGVPDGLCMDRVLTANGHKFINGPVINEKTGKYLKPAGWKAPVYDDIIESPLGSLRQLQELTFAEIHASMYASFMDENQQETQ